MSKKLQVHLTETQYREIRKVALAEEISVAEWVRRVLAASVKRQSQKDVKTKLLAIRAAVRHEFPTADIPDMLADISRGQDSMKADS